MDGSVAGGARAIAPDRCVAGVGPSAYATNSNFAVGGSLGTFATANSLQSIDEQFLHSITLARVERAYQKQDAYMQRLHEVEDAKRDGQLMQLFRHRARGPW